jgi:hypothetical protein
MAEQKQCSRCGYVTAVADFSNDRTTRDGRDPWSKALDNGRRSSRRLLRAVVARLIGRGTSKSK